MRRTLPAWGLAALVGAVVTWSLVRADFQLATDREPGEVVQSLTVRIDVGAQGGDLQEPVALDLGLGFPFWLHPVGRGPSETAPFGAVPQQTTAGAKVAAGSGATFTFTLAGDAGQDVLQTTSQLLAGVQVSDVARIGFASEGTGDWVLAGYEIQINGQTFAANDNVGLKASEAQDDARFELADLGLQAAPLEQEYGDLSALVQAQLAGPADLARLAEVQQQLAPLLARKRWLEGQVRGEYPWFEEPDFDSPWRGESDVSSVGVILVTDTHPGADTGNYVYFRSGGHKYLLSSPGEPLSGQLGAQEFAIDLLAGPLTAADMRGYSVGMLAHAQAYGSAPDRWHPQRILVGLDGRLVYDSDEGPIDLNSLEAIRVIPPAHVDEQGQVVENVPTARETFVWEAGKGMGLDLVAGGALPLPPPGDPGFPLPEPGLPGPGDMGGGGGFQPGFDPFPGEVIIWPGGGGWGGVGPGPGGIWPGWNPGWPAPPTWIDWVFGWLLPGLGVLPPWVNPPPVGVPFQIETVAITSGWQYDDTFTVEWTVSGDEAPIDHYEVSLMAVFPDQVVPFPAALASGNLPAGTRQFSSALPAVFFPVPLYLAPVVVAVPSDPAITPHQRIGPAKALFPPGTSPFSQPQLQNVYTRTNPPLLILNFGSVSFGGEPAGLGRAVWAAGEVESHNGILFDNASPAWNIGVRPEPSDRIGIRLNKEFFNGKHRVIACVGFLGGGGNAVDVRMNCSLERMNAPVPPPFTYPVQTANLVDPVGGPPAPMKILQQVVDRADAAWPGNSQLLISFTFEGGAVDPLHPPALFGLRVVPEP